MVFESIWNVWPFKGYFNIKNTRRYGKPSSRCSSQSKGSNEPLIQLLGPWESNIVAIQSILIWEKPGKSIVAVVAANVLYWGLVYSEVRFFFGLSMLGMVAFLHHQWVYSIWPEISVPPAQSDHEEWTPVHPSVLSAPEVSRYLRNTWKYIQEQQIRLTQLRRKQHGLFCFIMVTALSLLWLLGYFVPGVILLYALLMGIMCGPGLIIHFIPKSTFAKIEQITSFLFGKRNGSVQSPESELSEFLPEEESPEVQTALGIPLMDIEQMDDSLELQEPLTRGTGTSRGRRGRPKKEAYSLGGSSFVAGLSEEDFPSLEEQEDVIEESDLALPEMVSEGQGQNLNGRQGYNNDDEGSNGAIKFVPTHFGDSSDEDDDFVAGLNFRNETPTQETIDGHRQRPGGPAPIPVTINQMDQGRLGLEGVQYPAATAALVMNQLMGVMAPDNASFFSSIGQHLASAIGSGSVALTERRQHIHVPAPEGNPEAKMSISGSSFEEEFELISDDDLE